MILSIDGREVTAAEGATVLDAARAAGIYVPTLCHDPRLKPYGSCRLCIVEIDGMRGLPVSCATKAVEGMVVRTDTEEINRVRRVICEMIVADHPLDCLTCCANQTCDLQKVSSYLGLSGGRRLAGIEGERVVDESNPFYRRDMAKCIMCGKCVRACDELRHLGAIEISGRGYESRIAAFCDRPVMDSTCESCGECVDVCPTGALVAKSETVQPTSEVRTVCPYCGCGCIINLGVRAGRIVRVRADVDNPVNRGSLCVKGRFGLDFVGSDERLTTPLIRRNGELVEATWDEALSLVAEKMKAIRDRDGADAVGGLSSAKCTNEENYVFQKFIRAAVGTNNVDHCARLCHASTVAGLARAFGSGAMTNSIRDLEGADCIFVIGSNTTEAHPIVALPILDAVAEHGARLIVADPRRIPLVRAAEIHVRQKSGTDVALVNAIMNVIISERLYAEEFVNAHTEGFEEMKACVKDATPEWGEEITGVGADDIRAIARAFAGARNGSIVYSMGITQHSTGTDNVLSLANLAMLTGHIGRLSTGVNPLRGQNNVQGACDLGALPNVFPGYQAVTDDALRKKFEDSWGVKLPAAAGLTVVEMLHAAEEGKVKALYLMGENPMLSDPNGNRTRKGLESLELLVVQDIFLTETARLAHVVLPTASFAEKDGTFTNTERRVQRVRRAFPPPGKSRQDWEIVCEVSTRMGFKMEYSDPAAIMREIASLNPLYGGITFERIDGIGLQWPCPDENHPGTVFLHKDGQFKRGKGKFHAVPFLDPAELPDDDYPLILTTGRLLYHFHTGTMTRKTAGLDEIAPPTPCEINPEDAAVIRVVDGDAVTVTTRRGEVTARAVVIDRPRPGTVFMPFHYHEASANLLTIDALDPVAKIPEFKVCAVRVKKAS